MQVYFRHVNQEIYMALRPPASQDPADNPRFSAILAKARELAYPKANLEAAIAKVKSPCTLLISRNSYFRDFRRLSIRTKGSRCRISHTRRSALEVRCHLSCGSPNSIRSSMVWSLTDCTENA